MARLIAYRLLQLPLILAIIYLITFLLVWVAPGDPFGGEKNLDPTVIASLKATFHAESAWGFLSFYPLQLLQGNFGPSMQYREWTVNDIIRSALPISVILGLFAMVIATVFGILIGTMAAVRRGGLIDWLSLSIALIGISVPGFVVAALLLMLSASGPMRGVFAIGRFERPIDLLLPGIALALAPMAYIARLTRVSMLDVLSSDFVRTARAKGLSRSWVIWKHCLKNAILPVLSYLGPAAASTLVGSFVVEKVFNIPGLGQHFVNSILNRDRTLILGVVLVYSAFVLLFNLLVDLAYGLVDPRIQIGGAPMSGRHPVLSLRILLGGGVLAMVLIASLLTLPWTLSAGSAISYDGQNGSLVRAAPMMNPAAWFGYDTLGRSLLGRCLLGGSISLLIGFAAAAIAVVVGTTVGLIAGYTGGWVDSVLMRTVDVMYGLPYILLVILFKIALESPMTEGFERLQSHIMHVQWFSSAQGANLVVMFLSIGLVSWLTMARVVRGQVMALRGLPFVEAAAALGLPQHRIFLRHVLPNLVGPITVYATLTVPNAILQESFLSFLGVGVRLPLPTWGSLASDGVAALSPVQFYWWMLLFPCLLLMVALLGLNFLGDGLRDVLDPKNDAGKL